MRQQRSKQTRNRRTDAHPPFGNYAQSDMIRRVQTVFRNMPDNLRTDTLAFFQLPDDLDWDGVDQLELDPTHPDTIAILDMLYAPLLTAPDLPLDDPGVLALWMAHKMTQHEHNADPDNPELITRGQPSDAPRKRRFNLRYLGTEHVSPQTLYRNFSCPHHTAERYHAHIDELYQQWGTSLLSLEPITRMGLHTLQAVLYEFQELDRNPQFPAKSPVISDSPLHRPKLPDIVTAIAELEVITQHASTLLNQADTFRTYACDDTSRKAQSVDPAADPHRVLLLTSPRTTAQITELYAASVDNFHRGLFHPKSFVLQALRARYRGAPDPTVMNNDTADVTQFRPIDYLPDTVRPTRMIQGLMASDLTARAPDYAPGIVSTRLSKMANRPEEIQPTMREFSALSEVLQLPLSYWLSFICDDFRLFAGQR